MSTLVRPNVRPGRRHAYNDAGRPVCGGGNGGKTAHWQQDFGDDVNCQACRKIQVTRGGWVKAEGQMLKAKTPDQNAP
jgi:hypothetical protein